MRRGLRAPASIHRPISQAKPVESAWRRSARVGTHAIPSRMPSLLAPPTGPAARRRRAVRRNIASVCCNPLPNQGDDAGQIIPDALWSASPQRLVWRQPLPAIMLRIRDYRGALRRFHPVDAPIGAATRSRMERQLKPSFLGKLPLGAFVHHFTGQTRPDGDVHAQSPSYAAPLCFRCIKRIRRALPQCWKTTTVHP